MCKIQHNQINKIYLFRKWSNTCKLHVAERFSSVVLKNNEKMSFVFPEKFSIVFFIVALCIF